MWIIYVKLNIKKPMAKKVSKKTVPMFTVDKKVKLSEVRGTTDSEAVKALAMHMANLNADGETSILIGLHVAKNKKIATSLFLTAKRRLGDKDFIGRTILNERKVYQGTRIWRIKKAK